MGPEVKNDAALLSRLGTRRVCGNRMVDLARALARFPRHLGSTISRVGTKGRTLSSRQRPDGHEARRRRTPLQSITRGRHRRKTSPGGADRLIGWVLHEGGSTTIDWACRFDSRLTLL